MYYNIISEYYTIKQIWKRLISLPEYKKGTKENEKE